MIVQDQRMKSVAARPPRGRSLIRLAALSGLTALLVGCAGSGIFAPVSDISDRGVGGTYRVQAGDTLSSIARDTGVSVERLAALNNISNPSMIRVGQRLRLNDDAPAGGGNDLREATTPAQAPSRRASSAVAASTAATAAASEPSQPSRAADAEALNLVWPTKGKIIQRFTPQTKGIDIEGKIGQPVNAAADGKVVYAGDGVRGLGKLMIIDHGNGFITAYAHNDSLLLKTGDPVKRGARIATLGQTDATSPRLHFEVRRQGTPVDPLRYLPASE